MKTKHTLINRSKKFTKKLVRLPSLTVGSLQFLISVHKKLTVGTVVLLLIILSGFGPLNADSVSAQQPTLGSCVDADNDPATVGCSCEGDFVPSIDGSECIPATQTDCNGVSEAGQKVAINSSNCQIVKYLIIAINFLTAVAGIAIIGGMAHGGYLYQTARDNPGQVQAGRQRIVWALIALLLLVFGYAGLQWLVPGGILNGQAGNQPL